MTLPTNRTTGNTPAEHVNDHNVLHALHNTLQGSTTPSVVTPAEVAAKANDNAVVKLTGNQTKAGVLTFSSAPVVPDGSWSIADTSGLQAALDAIATGVDVGTPGGVDDTALATTARAAAGVGGTVVFSAGVYVVSALAASVANQRWVILPGATVKLKNTANTPVIDVTANGVTIEGGGTIDGNRANQGAPTMGDTGVGTTACVRIISRSDVTVRGVALINGASNGVLIDAGTNVTVDDCRISNCSPPSTTGNTKPVTIYDGVGASLNVRVTNNTIDGRTQATGCIGANISNARSLKEFRVTGNRLYVGDGGAVATLAVELFTSISGLIHDSIVSDNIIEGPSGVVSTDQLFGVSVGGTATGPVGGCHSVTVEGNVIRNCPSTGIEVIGRNVSITGNTIVNSGPITVLSRDVPSGIHGVSITGNTIVDSIDLSYCFRIHGDTTGIYGLVVQGNSVRNSAAGSVMLIDGIVSGASITGNTFGDVNGGPGISILGTMTDSVIANNTIDMTGVGGTTFDGILLSSTTVARLGINNNTIKGASRHGIYGLLSCSDVSIVGNRITNCTSSGIQADNAQTRWTVVANTVSNNGAYGIGFVVAAVDLAIASNTSHTNTTANYLTTGSTFLAHVINGAGG